VELGVTPAAASRRLASRAAPDTFELFRDIIILARDTGMRNRRELYRIRVENLDWNNRFIFVPDSKTADGRRMIPKRPCAKYCVPGLEEKAKGGCFRPTDRNVVI